jgi:hypothetical protein
VNLLAAIKQNYWAFFIALKCRCILDFLRAAAFFFMMPFRDAVSIFLTMSLSAASDDGSFFCDSAINFFTLVLTALLVVLFLIRLSSLCRWRFSAELFFFAKGFLQNYLKSDGRRSERLHFSHSATVLTLPLSKSDFILISPPQEQ